MALIQYELVKDKQGKYKVQETLVEVDKDDRIQFKSKIPASAILYQQAPSFKRSSTPQPKKMKAFEVGNDGIKGPFTVAKKLKAANRVMFKCGVLVQDGSGWNGTVAAAQSKFVPFPRFKGWGTPDDL